MLEEKNHVNSDTGFRLRYVKSETEYFRPHFHDFYEIFLILSDNVIHFINGSEQRLNKGDLIFIRNFDVHDYASANGERFEFLNLSFSADTFNALFDYLGDDTLKKQLLFGKMPPRTTLLSRDKEKLFFRLISLGDDKPKKQLKAHLRAILADIFVKYFNSPSAEASDIPLWLEMTCEKMKNPKNFIKGTEQFILLTGKSREHAAREMKRHYDTTITEFINELRLSYAVNLMKQSNLSVTDICYECGFSNLSWFYKIFADKFGKSPAAYKKEIKQKGIDK